MSSFKAKARTVELLGKKQIRDSVTALAELMKNSFDADAPWLRVSFKTTSDNPHIIVADKGLGMSKDDIENKWLVLGTNSKAKRTERNSPSGRPLMGAKGIGRLASATLGHQLWMLTKSKNSLWNIVFVNWDLFENQYISIDQVKVPIRSELTSQELLFNFDSIVSNMLEEQQSNLNNSEWKQRKETDEGIKALYCQIENALKQPSIQRQNVEQYISSLTSYNQGTILFIDQLNDDWKRIISPISAEERKNDIIADRIYSRFAAFVSTFRHTPSGKIKFFVEIYIDGEPWKEDYSFTEDDYECYDIKVSGTIKDGVFRGQLYSPNASVDLLQKCNNDLKEGIDVTAGIPNREDVDCGEFQIKFCHIEGDPERSGLSKDDYGRITRKLNTTCGISIFRDGVRVLPYGEPENDFLHIEARRTRKAGRYIFSHRNIFGRIDIDSVHNPMLEDKSSREGLIENAYYFYFVHAIQNLLITLALDYLSDVRKDSLGIQQSYVEKNIKNAEADKLKKQFVKEEQANAKKLIKKANSWLSESQELLNKLEMDADAFCAFSKSVYETASVNDGYNQLSSNRDSIIRKRIRFVEEAKAFQENVFEVPEHYIPLFPESLVSKLSDQNQNNRNQSNDLIATVSEISEEAVAHFECLIESWNASLEELSQEDPVKIKEELLSRIEAITATNLESLSEVAGQCEEKRKKVLQEITPVIRFVETVQNYRSFSESPDWINVTAMINSVSEKRIAVDSLFSLSPVQAIEKERTIIEELNKINKSIITEIQKIRYNETLAEGAMSQKASSLMAAIDTDSEVKAEQTIGFLRAENLRLEAELDIYSDLANMGLAAEIVSHEFNQLFINVNDAIRNMAPYVKDQAAKYWLRQIDMGFRSISDRQNQLSPMYRSYSLRKAPTQLRQFIEEVRRFIEGELKRNKVEFTNDVDPDVTVIISKSKVFPALSNLISNSLYWVKNQETKKILIRFDTPSRTLFVEDSGTGIVAAKKDMIFEPFVSYKPNGRGLGLTIARKVLESQGYKLEIASDDEKTLSGACFKIILSEAAMEEEK